MCKHTWTPLLWESILSKQGCGREEWTTPSFHTFPLWPSYINSWSNYSAYPIILTYELWVGPANCCSLWLLKETDTCNNRGKNWMNSAYVYQVLRQGLCVRAHFIKGRSLHFCSRCHPFIIPKDFPPAIKLSLPSVINFSLLPESFPRAVRHVLVLPLKNKNPFNSYGPPGIIPFPSSFMAQLPENFVVYSQCPIPYLLIWAQPAPGRPSFCPCRWICSFQGHEHPPLPIQRSLQGLHLTQLPDNIWHSWPLPPS